MFQEFCVEGVKHITPQNALAELENGTSIIIDVREEHEFKLEFIPLNNVFYYPMSVILRRLQNIPTDKSIIVVCNAGIRSAKVVDLLNTKGFADTANLDGGIIMWKALGLPIKSDLSPACRCSCS